MPRNITITFDDGSTHSYNGAPDDVTPEQIEARAARDFTGKRVTNIDGGRRASPTPAPVPVAPAPAAPPRQVGFAESAGRTAGAAAIPVVKMFGLAASTAASLFGRGAQDRVFEVMDRVTGRMEQEYRPQAGEEFDTAGSLAGGVVSMPLEVAGGFGLQHGVERAQDVVKRGGTVREAGVAGGVTGATRVALNALPVKAGGAVGRVVENAAGRVVGGALTGLGIGAAGGTAGRMTENAALPEGEQFADLQQQVTPTAAELGLAAGLGAVPGGMAAARTLRGAAETRVRDLPRTIEGDGRSLAMRAAEAIVKPNPVKLAEVAAIEKAGGVANIHNVTERPALREAGRAAQHIPLGGGKADQNVRAITKATVKLLDPEAKSAQLSAETLNQALDKSGSTISGNMASVGKVQADDAFKARMEGISKDAASIIDSNHRDAVIKRVRDTLARAEAGGGRLSGADLAEWDAALGKDIRDNVKEPGLVRRLHDIQDAVRDVAEKHMPPEKKKQTQAARRRYAYGMTLLPGIKDFGSTGYVDPKALWDIVNRDEAGRLRTLRGGSELTDLAKAANVIAEPEGHGRLSVGTRVGLGGGAGVVAYLNPGAAAAAAGTALAGSRVYNRVGPALVRRLAREFDAREAKRAAKPEASPPAEPALSLAPAGENLPPAARPDVRAEAPAEVPEWSTAEGAGVQAPGSQIPAIEPEGLYAAVGDDMPPARINPEPRPRVPDIPAVPGRPDVPDVMVAGAPKEIGATEATGRAMQSPNAALAREQQRFAPPKPAEPPKGGGGGLGGGPSGGPSGGQPPLDPRLAKIAELRKHATSPAVKKVLDAREAEVKKILKREQDVTDLEAAAQATDDVGLRRQLQAEADKLRGGKIPVGEVIEGQPDLPKPKAEKIPVGKVIEGQPEPPQDRVERLPVGETTEITPEVVEPAPERIPVGEATEMPEPLPVGEVIEDPIPVGEAMEFERLPVGEATEIVPDVVEPASMNAPRKAAAAQPDAAEVDAAVAARRGVETELAQTFPNMTSGEAAVDRIVGKVRAAWGSRRIGKDPVGFERETTAALTEALGQRKAWQKQARKKADSARAAETVDAIQRNERAEFTDVADELTRLESQGRLTPEEVAQFSDRARGAESRDAILDEMHALAARKNKATPTAGLGREAAVNEPVVPEATNVDNPPTAPAGGGRSGNMEQQKPQTVTHAGMDISEKVEDGKTRWVVTVPETGERVSTPNGLDAAKRLAENERHVIERQGTAIQRRAAADAEQRAAEAARAAAKKARSEATAGKTLTEIKAMDHMNRPVKYEGKEMKASELVDLLLERGDRPRIEQVDKIAPMSRMAFFRASNAEQRAHEAKVRAAGKKDTYWVGGVSMTKTEHDYAVRKLEKSKTPQEFAQQAGVRAEPEGGTGSRAPAEAGPGDRVPSAAGGEAKAPEVKPVGEPFYRDGVLVQPTGLFGPGDRVRAHDGGYLGTVDGLIAPDENGLVTRVSVVYDSGSRGTVQTRHLDAAEPDAPAAPSAKPAKGMTLEEAKAHVAQANIDRPLGGSWDRIEAMQGGKLVRPRASGGGAEAPKAEAPKAEAPKAEAPKAEAPKAEAPEAKPAGTPDRRAAIDAETMETRRPVEVAQPTAMKSVLVPTVTLSGPKNVRAKLYELPGYDGPQLAVAEYKSPRGVGYRVYLPKSGALIQDSNGVQSLADTLQSAVLRVGHARDTLRSRAAPAGGGRSGNMEQQKPAGKALSPAEVKAEFQRQIDAVARFDAGGPETITLTAGGSRARIQNTARRVAEYMKALDTVKGGKTPKPVSRRTAAPIARHKYLATKREPEVPKYTPFGAGTGKRADLTVIKDMIDDMDPQAAVDFAADRGIDLEAALKDDRKRLDQVRGMKPTPETP